MTNVNHETGLCPERHEVQVMAAAAIERLINDCRCNNNDDVLSVLGVLLNTGVAAVESVKSGQEVIVSPVVRQPEEKQSDSLNNEMLVAELTMWIKRLSFSMRNNANPPGVMMANDAMNYLKRQKLISINDAIR
ncbi:hypothetical protein F3I27_21845 [Pantoea sp. Bo_2]|uniref:Uncharacterized protein n=3 Tax=Pantoea TaxID=53335 RepID=A0AB34CKS4_9GAMM|nr:MULTISPECIES: hypothetical protein [Pantoea]KAA5937581.1 hypothetical protein F3I57_21320 [Pantoea sp. VH_3]KAA5946712.1 hypothetical protein F3I56_22105 [Pantoea sp. VH_25]KAA5949532.1 hypothetical protein F3I55_22460 [Pantoea sp. VH_24]KAA5957721.1 hypothetical protein F3I53_15835 [Pantoea sp. VH_16]KAA5959146.1 hypothetical protein F3I54_22490 [Pantoea sp. VH_18]